MDKWCAVHPYNGILFRIKIIATSFKRFHACAATLNALNPPGCHPPLPVTLGHSWLNLGQSLVGSLLLSSHDSARIRKSNENKVMSLYARGGPGRDSEAG